MKNKFQPFTLNILLVFFIASIYVAERNFLGYGVFAFVAFITIPLGGLIFILSLTYLLKDSIFIYKFYRKKIKQKLSIVSMLFFFEYVCIQCIFWYLLLFYYYF